MDLLIKGEGGVLDKGDDQRQPEGDNDGDDIESHLALERVDVFKIDTASEVDHQKNQDRQQGSRVRFALVHEK